MAADTAVESMGARLRRIRVMRGLSQEALALRAGVARPLITRIETGSREGEHMLLGSAMRLAWALGVSLDMLAGMPDLRG